MHTRAFACESSPTQSSRPFSPCLLRHQSRLAQVFASKSLIDGCSWLVGSSLESDWHPGNGGMVRSHNNAPRGTFPYNEHSTSPSEGPPPENRRGGDNADADENEEEITSLPSREGRGARVWSREKEPRRILAENI